MQKSNNKMYTLRKKAKIYSKAEKIAQWRNSDRPACVVFLRAVERTERARAFRCHVNV
jgi:hypothetical protein